MQYDCLVPCPAKKNFTLTFAITFFLLDRLPRASDMFRTGYPPGCKPQGLAKNVRTAEIYTDSPADQQNSRVKSACARKTTCTHMLLRMGRLGQVHRNAVVMFGVADLARKTFSLFLKNKQTRCFLRRVRAVLNIIKLDIFLQGRKREASEATT